MMLHAEQDKDDDFGQEEEEDGHDEEALFDLNANRNEEWIMLNVGGKLFSTTRTTLCTSEPNSMLARMFSQQNCHASPARSASAAGSRRRTGASSNDSKHLASQQLYNTSARLYATSTSSIGLQPSPRDANGAYLIDRSPKYFEPILNYLRHGKLIIDHDVNVQGVLEEAKFYGIVSLLPMLELETERLFKRRHQDMLKEAQMFGSFESHHASNLPGLSIRSAAVAAASDHVTSAGADGTQLQTMPPLTRQDVIRAIITTSAYTTDLRFQGCNLAGANLSKLDLRHINFKYANLRNSNLKGANLSYSNLERADLYQSNLEGAQLIGANLVCTNLENSNLRAITTVEQSNDKTKPKTTFEGANLKNTNFEGSQLMEVNLRKATLRGSNLQNCDLSRAILAATDLENCDLSGSDLNEANLRNANVKGAQFELEVL